MFYVPAAVTDAYTSQMQLERRIKNIGKSTLRTYPAIFVSYQLH